MVELWELRGNGSELIPVTRWNDYLLRLRIT
jgi:hypothetical protein